MKIIYLSRSILPSKTANSVHVMKMCQAMAKNGHSVTLVASIVGKRVANSIYDYYGVDNNFEISFLRGRSDWLTGLLLFLLNFFRYIKKIKPPDLFFARDLFTLTVATMIYRKVPFYYEAHIPPPTVIHLFLTRYLLKRKNLVKLIVITNSLKDEYLKMFPVQLDHKIMVAPDGADIPDQPDTGKVTNTDGRVVIGYVGHLYPGRGIEIIHELAGKLPQHDFHIVGGSEKDIAHWQKTCHPLGNVIFKGFVPQKELNRYYRDIDIVLAPYQGKVSISGGGDTGRWMSPLKIFEYMAFAKPIIASDLPVLREILTHGYNALLCKPDCPSEWVDAVTRLVNDKELREKLAKNAFEYLKNNYTWQKRAANILGPSKQRQ